VKNHKHHDAAVQRARQTDRTSAGRIGGRLDWRSLLLSFIAALALSASPGLPGFARDAMAQKVIQIGGKRTLAIVVPVGKSEDVRTDSSFVDIMIGDPEIADVNALTDRTLSILGKKLGTTRVSIYGEGKKLIGVFDVEVSYDTSALAAELSRRFPTNKLRVSSVNGRILLTGTVSDGVVLDRILTVARQFGPEVINSVQVAQPQQVMLEVRFVEASRQAGRELGVQWNVLPTPGHRQSFVANVGDQLPAGALPTAVAGAAGVLGGGSPFGFLAGNMIAKGLQIDVMLNALETRGLARRLAEPNLVALSGDTANFLAGGEYPIPVPGSFAGQISVDYKKYGVSLAFTPTVLQDSLINLKIEPEVSQIDPTTVITVGSITIPALIVRRANTTVELRDGQSFAISGLLDHRTTDIFSKMPGIGDVPILGQLFRSKDVNHSTVELMVVVTPILVDPLTDVTSPALPKLPVPLLDPTQFDKTMVKQKAPAKPQAGGPQ